MATFETRVENYVGAIAADQTVLDDFLTEVSRDIISVLPNKYLSYMSEPKTDSDGVAGIALNNCRILHAEKSGYEAKPKPYAKYAQYTDAGSMFLATAKSPISMLNAGKGYVVPGGGIFHVVEYPVILYTDDFGSYASTDKVPEEIEPLLVYGASMRWIIKDLVGLATMLTDLPTLATNDYVLITTALGGGYSQADIKDPITKAQTLIDAGATAAGDSATAALSAQTNIVGDDFAKARVSIETAAQEVNRARAMLENRQAQDTPELLKWKSLLEEYSAVLNAYIARHGALSQRYSIVSQLYNEGLGKLIGQQRQQ